MSTRVFNLNVSKCRSVNLHFGAEINIKIHNMKYVSFSKSKKQT